MITIRHIERTCLKEEPYKKLIEKYANLKHDLLVVFDLRINCFGIHTYDFVKQLHTIRIGPFRNSIHIDEKGNTIDLDTESEKYNLISTTLHELYHGFRRETLKQSFFNKDYCEAKVKNRELKELYSQCELEARTFETSNILQAVEYYNNLIK